MGDQGEEVGIVLTRGSDVIGSCQRRMSSLVSYSFVEGFVLGLIAYAALPGDGVDVVWRGDTMRYRVLHSEQAG